MIFNFMAIRKKSGLVPPTLHYCGHNAKKIGPKKSLLKICTLYSVSSHLSAALPTFLNLHYTNLETIKIKILFRDKAPITMTSFSIS